MQVFPALFSWSRTTLTRNVLGRLSRMGSNSNLKMLFLFLHRVLLESFCLLTVSPWATLTGASLGHLQFFLTNFIFKKNIELGFSDKLILLLLCFNTFEKNVSSDAYLREMKVGKRRSNLLKRQVIHKWYLPLMFSYLIVFLTCFNNRFTLRFQSKVRKIRMKYSTTFQWVRYIYAHRGRCFSSCHERGTKRKLPTISHILFRKTGRCRHSSSMLDVRHVWTS